MRHILSRRSFVTRGAIATAAATGNSLFWTPSAQAEMPRPKASGPLEEKLDAYIASYMPAMNAPGLTLGLTDASKTLRTAGYGYANVDQHLAVAPSHLFQIGSITKSFVALVLLQMRDEGKLDLHKRVLDYLPWLPIAESFGLITVHHLLTHTSGLPDALSLFATDPTARLQQEFKPGEHFHYCNAGFDILGELASKLDGRPWRECVQARILIPLEMTESTGVLTTSARDRSATGYQSYWDDQVYPRQGKLAPASNLVMDDTAGCIASTPADMARYARMILNRGRVTENAPNKRIVSEESFTLFSTPYIKAEEFSPTASYGYGIAIDTLDGHKILRHTGGMVSFASSIHVDLDGGVAAFASINAMQGYRPTAVTEYAVRLLRAQHESKPLPDAQPIADPTEVETAADYAGTYTSADGRKLAFKTDGKHLSLIAPETSEPCPLQHAGGDAFLSAVEGKFTRYSFEFGRKDSHEKNSAAEKKAGDPKPPVVEVSYGPDWYTNQTYDSQKTFHVPAEYAAYVGHYRSDSPWGGDARVFVQKDKLTVGGSPLTPIGNGLFRSGEEPWSPDTVEFHHIVESKARLMKLSGIDFWRIEVD
jgi:D-alanyl-D-alanine carboxypeptidase